jgi:hypothetical protein
MQAKKIWLATTILQILVIAIPSGIVGVHKLYQPSGWVSSPRISTQPITDSMQILGTMMHLLFYNWLMRSRDSVGYRRTIIMA